LSLTIDGAVAAVSVIADAPLAKAKMAHIEQMTKTVILQVS